MIFEEQKLPGVYLIKPEPFTDERGVFRRNFCDREFKKAGIVTNIKQCNVSENIHKHTLRGFHYQLPPHGEGKTLSCFNGRIHDIVVDVRPQSPTYLKWISLELSIKNKHSVHVPPGCANAFLTLEPGCVIYYFCSESYHQDSERGVRFNDPSFKFDWPVAPEFISDKDATHPDFTP